MAGPVEQGADGLWRHSRQGQRLQPRQPADAARRDHRRQASEIHPVDLPTEQVQEFVPHSWYKYEDEAKGLHPWDGVTEPNYELGKNAKGTSTRIEELDESAKYSWIKARAGAATRWRWAAGALHHRLSAGPQGHQGAGGRPAQALDVPFEAIFSTLGRTAARALEAQWAAEKQKYFLDKLIANIKAGDTATANTAKFDPSTWPRSQGRGLYRGAARRAGALDPHQGRQDRQLPVRGAHHLERSRAIIRATSAPLKPA
jgi:Ni,Fe-hydrogenase I large subunit